jgi:hypothetical protein
LSNSLFAAFIRAYNVPFFLPLCYLLFFFHPFPLSFLHSVTSP